METVKFGNYYFEATREERKPVSWLVIKEDKGKKLLLSKYGIDLRSFNAEWQNVSWDASSLRRWLNDTFLHACFSEAEREKIINDVVRPDPNPLFPRAAQGKKTKDKIFILSISQCLEALGSDGTELMLNATPYAKKIGAATFPFESNKCFWWLRNTGEEPDCACYISNEGVINYEGIVVDYAGYVVRPAMWVKK